MFQPRVLQWSPIQLCIKNLSHNATGQDLPSVPTHYNLRNSHPLRKYNTQAQTNPFSRRIASQNRKGFLEVSELCMEQYPSSKGLVLLSNSGSFSHGNALNVHSFLPINSTLNGAHTRTLTGRIQR